MSDERIECVECGRAFIWSSGEQRFYQEHRLDRPKRCPNCRSHRRDERRSGMRGLVGPPGLGMPPAPRSTTPRSASPGFFDRIIAFLKRILS
jgi:DNA-directed RNA polymerase subunit RPC12/RpoP